jgi:hypothetical protein
MRDAVKDQAELIAVSPASRKDLIYGSDQDMEKADRAKPERQWLQRRLWLQLGHPA